MMTPRMSDNRPRRLPLGSDIRPSFETEEAVGK
jgi:hypothetical protein